MHLSIIITNFNQAESVNRMLDQLAAEDLRGVEVIVSDDFSRDDSVARIREHMRHLDITGMVSTADRWGHVGAARNRGVCKNKIFAMYGRELVP